MVEVQLRERGIRDERVLEAMARVPRERFVGDGTRGYRPRAPYTAIAIAAAAPALPRSLYEQLEPRGRLVVPVGERAQQRLELFVRSPEGPAMLRSVPCRFVPLVGEEGFDG